ncbi:MAG: SagB/ThcOx family dehydrogenase [Candidatus Mcinerneyibacterium aminivorans]|uniref:SagB/ThcOx family dehydrogenase n=1 Tax=Candidatus Mcinerneyibacterium aminivorans TaxID=2703815 RepID=A0A5D0MDA2_9BACT|nr:MAG: SagB/ThcOx family dehydrogenase [Candidatus Mcinerneyibacterium aminivorans]
MDLDKSRIKIESLIKETEEEIYEALAYTENLKSKIKKHRKLMKANRWKDIKIITDNFKNIPEPPEQKDYDEDSKIIELPEPDKDIIKKENIYNCITERESRRKYSDESLSLKELSYLLYATQGVRERNDNYHKKTVPSGGARQPFETYIAVNNIEDLKRGIYRYLIFEHKLLYMKSPDNQKRLLKDAALGQEFVANSAAVFFWAALPYRVEWGYFLKSHKIILLEGGHVCQNLYLASESINCGTCAIGAYDQEKSDELLELDGEDEFVIYLAPVGKV